MTMPRLKKIAFLIVFLLMTFSINWEGWLLSSPALQDTQPQLVGFSNPAAVYCLELGYEYMLDDNTGSCVLPDKTICPDWDFLSGKCGADYSVCSQHGLETITRNDGQDAFSQEYAVCVDQDQKEVANASDLINLFELSIPSCVKEYQEEPIILEKAAAIPENVLTTLPASFDWRNRPQGNYLTNIRNQGSCGSCWSFAVVGVTEAALNIANNTVGNNYDLSEQYMVTDCDTVGDCCGGYTNTAMGHMVTIGVPDEACLPYADGGGCTCSSYHNCNTDCTYSDNTSGNYECSNRECADRCSDWESRMVTLDHYGYVSSDRPTIQAELIEKGPLKAAMYWSNSSSVGRFTDGVYNCDQEDISGTNHAVILVGYDDAGGYWLVRNSWGTWFQDDGYFKLAYGSCNIETSVRYGTIDGVVLAPPALTAPDDAAYTADSTPTFEWEDVINATGYTIEVADNDEFVNPVDAAIVESTYTPIAAFTPDTYFWRVKATSSGLESDWSEVWSFTISTNGPTILGPANGFSTTDHTPNFAWESVPGATSYVVQVSPREDFSILPINHTVTNSFFAPGVAMINQPYWWRVIAIVGGTLTEWSEVRTITITGAPGNAAPVAISPEDGATTIDRTPTFDWTDVPTAVRYRIQMSLTPGFGVWLVNQTVTESEFTPGVNFNPGTYYWRVQAEGGGDSSWFSIRREITITE